MRFGSIVYGEYGASMARSEPPQLKLFRGDDLRTCHSLVTPTDEHSTGSTRAALHR